MQIIRGCGAYIGNAKSRYDAKTCVNTIAEMMRKSGTHISWNRLRLKKFSPPGYGDLEISLGVRTLAKHGGLDDDHQPGWFRPSAKFEDALKEINA